MNGFKNHSVEIMSEVSQKSNVKVVTKTDQMVKRIKKHSRTYNSSSPEVQFKEFILTTQKTRPRAHYE